MTMGMEGQTKWPEHNIINFTYTLMNLVWCISITNFPFSFSYRVVHICRSLGLFFIWLLWFAHQHCKLACLKSGIRTIWRIGPEPHQFSGAVSCQTSSRTDGSDSHWFWSKRRSTEKNSLSEPAALPENNLLGLVFNLEKSLIQRNVFQLSASGSKYTGQPKL